MWKKGAGRAEPVRAAKEGATRRARRVRSRLRASAIGERIDASARRWIDGVARRKRTVAGEALRMRLPCAPRMEAIGRWEAVGARRAAIGGCDEACDTSAGVGTSVEWNGSPAHVVDSAFGRWDRPTEWAGGASRRPETESDRRMRRRARCASSNASAATCLGVGVRGPAPGVGPAGSRAERAGGAKRREGDVCGGGRHARARTSQPKRKGRSNAGRNGVRRAETADWRKGPRARRAHGQTGKRANARAPDVTRRERRAVRLSG